MRVVFLQETLIGHMENLGLGELLPVPSIDTKVCNNMFKIIYTVHILRSGCSDQNAQ
jgi:hypothetical protein